jgi:hypothetical protein
VGIQDHQYVEVVIDDFHYTPSGLTALPDGGICSKDCQCGPDSLCQNNRCIFVAADINSSFRGDPAPSSLSLSNNEGSTNEVSSAEKDNTNSVGVADTTNQAVTVGKDEAGGEILGETGLSENEMAMASEASKSSGGLKKAGISLLVIGILGAAGTFLFLYVKAKRNNINEYKNKTFKIKYPSKTVVVDCWEEATTNEETSFEMSIGKWG